MLLMTADYSSPLWGASQQSEEFPLSFEFMPNQRRIKLVGFPPSNIPVQIQRSEPTEK